MENTPSTHSCLWWARSRSQENVSYIYSQSFKLFVTDHNLFHPDWHTAHCPLKGKYQASGPRKESREVFMSYVEVRVPTWGQSWDQRFLVLMEPLQISSVVKLSGTHRNQESLTMMLPVKDLGSFLWDGSRTLCLTGFCLNSPALGWEICWIFLTMKEDRYLRMLWRVGWTLFIRLSPVPLIGPLGLCQSPVG